MSSATLLQLVDKTSDWDKDERYMATNDLCNLLSKDVRVDEHVQQKVCVAILKQLDDPSNDVQSVAVKCLGVLVKKVAASQLGDIAKRLIELVLNGQDALRDIYSIGLKTCINDVSDGMGPVVVEKLSAKLLAGVGGARSAEVKRECLDILHELLKRFGHLCEAQHQGYITALVELLKSDKPFLKKRAISCIAVLSVVLSDALLTSLVTSLLQHINSLPPSSPATAPYIQSVGSMSRLVGHRLAKYLPDLLPLFLTYLGDATDEDTHTEAYNDLRESIFPALESFLLRCPKEVSGYIHTESPNTTSILSKCIAFVKYDPNYVYESDEGEGDMAGEDEDWGDGDDGAGGWDEGEEDGSWKVRKAALRTIHALITIRGGGNGDKASMWDIVAQELLTRLKEREENVLVDVLSTFTHLVRMGSSALPFANPSVDKVITTSVKMLAGKASARVKGGVMTMLRYLAITTKGGWTSSQLQGVWSTLPSFLLDKSTGKLEALQLIQTLFTCHDALVVQSGIHSLLPALLTLVKEEGGFKVVGVGVGVVGVMLKVMRPGVQIEGVSAETVMEQDAAQIQPVVADYQTYLSPILDLLLGRIARLDMDSEVRETCIHTASVFLAYLGDAIPAAQTHEVLRLFIQRLQGESVRVSVMRGLERIARSPLPLPFTEHLPALLPPLLHILTLGGGGRAAQVSALTCLLAVLRNRNNRLEDGGLEQLVKGVAGALGGEGFLGADVHVTSLALQILLTLAQTYTSLSAPLIHTYAYSQLIGWVKSGGLAVGEVLDNITQLLIHLVRHYVVSLDSVLSTLGDINTKTGIGGVARCIAGVCVAMDGGRERVAALLRDMHSTETVPSLLALHTLGCIGERVDLSASGGEGVFSSLLVCMAGEGGRGEAEGEKRAAAAVALGHVCVGNLSHHLPLLLGAFNSSTSTSSSVPTYLLLTSLREVLQHVYQHGDGLGALAGEVLRALGGLAREKHDDPAVPPLLSDCLGLTLHLLPSEAGETLVSLGGEGVLSSLLVVLHSLKACLTRPLSPALTPIITRLLETYLPCVQRTEVDVQRGGWMLVNTAIHHNPHVMVAYLSGLHPFILQSLQLKMEKVVDLGPFKHKVDDALPIRKLCLSCVESILHNLPSQLDAMGVLQLSTVLLADHDDIKQLYLQLLVRIVETHPTALATQLDSLPPLLEKILGSHSEKSTVASGSKELLKAVVRLVLRLDRVEDAKDSRRWGEFSSKVRKSESLGEIVRGIESEHLDA